MEDLLLLCCQRIGKAFLVLDGLDECEDHEVLTSKLLKISEINDFRAILFSRPTISLLAETIQSDCRLSVGRRSASAIKLYLQNRLIVLIERRILSKKTKALEILDRLVQRVDGMFLWARLFTTYVASMALSVAQREDALVEVNLPTGLEQMYDKIFSLILSGNKASWTLARLVFMWLLHGREELGASMLEEASIMSQNGPKSSSNDKFNDFESTVIVTCGDLVEQSSMPAFST
ncbi:hypothetical protein G7Y89_g4512 [Cudoniella acicularis]|uniref:NACHT domain-containing protein n=1 Tax=Cudoniella acicularis TaxID=354080 RepID=A0A8H4RPA9_9HELO|nr:hypothetical protein G7Y89_g4512 [Cudoniella acicularis]